MLNMHELEKLFRIFLQLCFPGIPKGKFNEFIKRDPKGYTSSKGIKNVGSLWGSIKNFLRYSSVMCQF